MRLHVTDTVPNYPVLNIFMQKSKHKNFQLKRDLRD
jgi:hypothetical protein